MKILVSKIKNWNESQKLEEIYDRVSDVHSDETVPSHATETLDEVLQILTYWKHHMETNVEKSKKKKSKKEVNLW